MREFQKVVTQEKTNGSRRSKLVYIALSELSLYKNSLWKTQIPIYHKIPRKKSKESKLAECSVQTILVTKRTKSDFAKRTV